MVLEDETLLDFATATEMRLSFMLGDMDDIVAMLMNPETAQHVANNEVMFGKILTRAQLVASMLEARKPPRFRVVK